MKGQHRAAGLAIFKATGVEARQCSARQGSSPVIAAMCGRTELDLDAYRAATNRLLADPARFRVYKPWESRLGYASTSFYRTADKERHLYTLFYANGSAGEPDGSVTLNVLAF